MKTSVIIFVKFIIFFLDNNNVEGYRIENGISDNQIISNRQNPISYQVMIISKRSSRKRILCAGSLLNDEWILTAGHCLNGFHEFEIYYNGKSSKHINDQERITLKSDKCILHENYNAKMAANDIGLIKLMKNVQLNKNEKFDYVQLPNRKDNEQLNGRHVIAGGWDLSTNGKEQLDFAHLKVITNKECMKNFDSKIISEKILCAKSLNYDNVCTGDSGGPLVLAGTKTLVGITSFGHILGCDFNLPDGFTRISSYIDWIYEKTGIRPPK